MTDSPARAAPPNYAARRMLVSAAAIAAIVVAASVVWQRVRGDDPPAVATPATWDAIAFVAGASGAVTLVDPEGAVVARYDGDGRVASLHAAGSTVALVHSDSVTLLDLGAEASGDRREVALPERARLVSRLATSRDRLLLGAGSRSGGAVRVIDGATGGSYDLADLAGLTNPLLYTGTLRVDPAGTTVAVADATSFQTIVVGGIGAAGETSDDPDGGEPIVANFAAQPLAVDAHLLATTQVVGGRADVTVHPLDGPASAPVPMDIPAGGVLADGRLIAVTTDGAVVAIRVGDRQPRQLATLAIPTDATVTGVYAAANGERIVVHAGSYVGVLDTDGRIVYEGVPQPTSGPPASSTSLSPTSIATPSTGATVASTTPTTSSSPGTSPASTPDAEPTAPAEPVAPVAPGYEWACLPLALGTSSAALISLTDGAELAELDGVAMTGASADGCTVIGTDGDRAVVVGAAGRGDLGPARDTSLSPDGRAVLVSATSREVALVPLGDDLQPGTPIDVSAAVPRSTWSAVFVER